MSRYKMVAEGLTIIAKKAAFLDTVARDFNTLVTHLQGTLSDNVWSEDKKMPLEQYLDLMNGNEFGVRLSIAWTVLGSDIHPTLHQDKADGFSSEAL